jgi:L-threonylcarbamoyladenylate synthase
MNKMLPLDQISHASQVISSGGIVLYPADTIWGLGCNALDQSAYEKLTVLKDRKSGNPFILLVSDLSQLKNYVEDIHPRIETLLHFLKRSLTLIYPNPKNLPEHCLGKDGSVAIRIVQDEFCQQLIKTTGVPITSTSPNKEGENTPAHFGEINSDILSGVDFVFDYKRSRSFLGKPSVIAKFNRKGELLFIRE